MYAFVRRSIVCARTWTAMHGHIGHINRGRLQIKSQLCHSRHLPSKRRSKDTSSFLTFSLLLNWFKHLPMMLLIAQSKNFHSKRQQGFSRPHVGSKCHLGEFWAQETQWSYTRGLTFARLHVEINMIFWHFTRGEKFFWKGLCALISTGNYAPVAIRTENSWEKLMNYEVRVP